MYYWHFNVAPVYFWLKFKLKREQGTFLWCICLHIGRVNITNICDCKRATKQHKCMCLLTSIIKNQTAKERSLGIKCVSLLHINFDGFSLSATYIAAACCYEKDFQFSWEIWAAKVYTSGENQLACIFFCGFRGGNEKFAEIRAGSHSHLTALPLDFACVAMPCAPVLQCMLVLQTWCFRQFTVFLILFQVIFESKKRFRRGFQCSSCSKDFRTLFSTVMWLVCILNANISSSERFRKSYITMWYWFSYLSQRFLLEQLDGKPICNTKFFPKGSCGFGASCWYSHVNPQMLLAAQTASKCWLE